MIQKQINFKVYCFTILFFFGFLSLPVLGDETIEVPACISEGKILPKITLLAPCSAQEKQYLGLNKLETFTLSQIQSKLIVLEVFSVYCPHCRKQAPKLNKIYKLVQDDSLLSNNVKMIGIASGAKQDNVDKWKAALHVPYPIFSDKEAIIWNKFGKPGIPCTMLVDGKGKVLAIHLGVTEDEEHLFNQIKEKLEE